VSSKLTMKKEGYMDNTTAFWLLDILLAPVLIICFTIIISILSIVWSLAIKTFKKVPWEYMWIFIISFLSVLTMVWIKLFPKLWLKEFKKRKEEIE
jgi:hypothetical protein